MQSLGIRFKKVEIDFIYSFFCRIPKFDKFLNTVNSLGSMFPNQHATIPVSELDDLILENKIQYNRYYWTIGINPERIGLSPLLRIGRLRTLESGQEKVVGQISCFIKRKGPFEVLTALDYANSFDSQIDESAFLLPLDDYEILLRLMDNGMGSVTFKFILESDQLWKYFENHKYPKEKLLFKHLGILPFIFNILTLGRTELAASKDGIPFSKLGIRNGDTHGYQELSSLYHVLNNFLFKDVIETLQLAGIRMENSNRGELNKNIAGIPVDVKIIESIDDELRIEIPLEKLDDRKPWQTPYVCIYADLIPESTQIKRKGKQHEPWWFIPDHGYITSPKRAYETLSSEKIDVKRCYREAILLLLRLYQWRYFLGVDEFLKRLSVNEYKVTEQMDKILMPPELFSSKDKLFKDINLVWDSRYLMLYHKRSTIVFNCVENSISTDKIRRRDFKELFRQSLLGSLEIVRAQWHGAVVMGLNLDYLIDKLSTSESSRDIKILSEVAAERSLYAKLLRDPFSIGTDAAALAEVRERAEYDYQINELYAALRDKFQAIDSLIADQSMIQNIAALSQFRLKEGEN